MRIPARSLFLFAAAMLLVAVPSARAWAQAAGAAKPIMVLSVAKVDELMSDVGYLTRAAGMPEAGGFVTLMAGQFTQGLDTTKPAGLYVTMEGAEPQVIGFVPIANFDIVSAKIQEQAGDLEDAGNGIKKVNLDQPVFLKPQGGWVFLSNNTANLAQVPNDPSALLGGMEKSYEISVKLLPQNIPQQLRDMAITQIRAGVEMGLANEIGNGEIPPELMRKLQQQQLKQLTSLINDSEELTIGWAVDSQGKKTYIDFSLTAQEGSDLAQQMAVLGGTKSAFAGFLLPNAAATLNITGRMTQDDIEQTTLVLDVMKQKAAQEIDNDESLPNAEARAAVKGVLNSLMDVMTRTVQEGTLDGGAVVVLEPNTLRFAAGGHVADGPALEQAFKQLIELAKNEPEVPEVKFNAETHAGVNFHTVSVPLPEGEEDARKVLGDNLDVVLGTGAKSLYVAFGKDSTALLKQVIDASASTANPGELPPFQLQVALGPIVKFAASIQDDPNLQTIAAALDQSAGMDHFTVTAKPIPRGVAYRLEVQEGVLKLIGQAAKARAGG